MVQWQGQKMLPVFHIQFDELIQFHFDVIHLRRKVQADNNRVNGSE
jgi:hypothetical protein